MPLLWSPVAKCGARDDSEICPEGCRCRFRTSRSHRQPAPKPLGRDSWNARAEMRPDWFWLEAVSVFWRLSGGAGFLFVQTGAEFLPVLVPEGSGQDSPGQFQLCSFGYLGFWETKSGGILLLHWCFWLLKVCKFGRSQHLMTRWSLAAGCRLHHRCSSGSVVNTQTRRLLSKAAGTRRVFTAR